jgi:hypothetical protein
LPVRQAAQVDLALAPDRSVLLSWVEGGSAGRTLRFARLRDGSWSEPRTIATGDWFGNAMDVPHLRETPDGALWMARPARGSGSKYASDILLSRSDDDGRTWSPPIPVNDDGTPTEHGFVSAWASGHDQLAVAWLDGRATAPAPVAAGTGGEHAVHAGPMGATMLRSAHFGPGLMRTDEATLDAMTCDCCQTNVAIAGEAALLAYRGRTATEERDILVTRLQGRKWSRPALVAADHWVMPACPVNGPALAADGQRVGVAWYTAPGERPKVRLASSSDGGAHFGNVRDLDAGADVGGQAGIALAGHRTWVSWLRATATGQALWVAAFDGDSGSPTVKREVATLQSRGRVGAPRLLAIGNDIVLVWVDAVDGNPELKSLRLHLR